VSRLLAQVALLSVSRERAVNNLLVDFAHVLVPHTETVRHTRTVPLDYGVGVLDERVESVERVVVLQVEFDAPLAAVYHREDAAGAVQEGFGVTREVSVGRLHLHYVGTQVGEQLCRVRSRQQSCEVYDAYVFEHTPS